MASLAVVHLPVTQSAEYGRTVQQLEHVEAFSERAMAVTNNKMPVILALRVMLGLIHLFQLYASLIDKTILANGIV